MPIFTILIGALMDGLGFIGYFASESRSVTAFIPAIFGTLFIVCGLVAIFRDSLRKHMMHTTAALSAIGLIGVLPRSAGQFPALLSGAETTTPPLALTMQLLFAILCLVYLLVCINSFVQARKKQAAARRAGA